MCNNLLNDNLNLFSLRKVTWRIKKKVFWNITRDAQRKSCTVVDEIFFIRCDKLCIYITSYKALYKSLQIYILIIVGLHSHDVAFKKSLKHQRWNSSVFLFVIQIMSVFLYVSVCFMNLCRFTCMREGRDKGECA